MRLPDANHSLRMWVFEVARRPHRTQLPSVRAPKNWVVSEQAPQTHHEANGVTLLTVKQFGNGPEFPPLH